MTLRFSDSFAAQRIVFGAGEFDRLGELAGELDVKYALLCTSRSYVRNGAAGRAGQMLGFRLAGCFDAVQPHVPEESVEAAFTAARGASADAVIALGGGSAVGTAKAVTARLNDARAESLPVPLIAIPTTYAGSEMTSVYGRTRAGHKYTFADPRTLPYIVLYDPDLTLDLPAILTAGTGANALAHCVEGVYSRRRTPVGTASALDGAARLSTALPRLMHDGQDRHARETMLAGSHLAGITIAHAGMALHHAICHALGGAGVPHGVANRIMLAHVMRFNLPAAAAEIADIGRALDPASRRVTAASAADRAVDRVDELMRSLPLPGRLRDIGIPEPDLSAIAAHALASATARANPRSATAEDVVAILQAAW